MPDFEQLVEQLYASAGSRLAHYGLLLTGSLGDAEDLVQDAVVKVFVRHRGIEDLAHAERYVRATMRTLHIDRMRRERRWRLLIPRVVAEPSSADAYAAVDDSLAVAAALSALPPRMRTAVALRLIDDMTVADVAEAMGLGVGTVKKYLSEARERLGNQVRVSLEDEERWQVADGRAR